ncbi:hypothetical protein RUND412_000016 [Rhizina undulata]
MITSHAPPSPQQILLTSPSFATTVSLLSNIPALLFHIQATTLRLLYLQLHSIFSLLFTFGNFSRCFTQRILENIFTSELKKTAWKRWERVKDKVFYETLLLLLQPNPFILVLMWPGWIFVGAWWLWWTGSM